MDAGIGCRMKRSSAVFKSLLCICLALALNACSSDTARAPVLNGWYLPSAKKSYYRVKTGDTLYSIAWMFGLDYRSLADRNGLRYPYKLVRGQKILMSNVPVGAYQSTNTTRSKQSKQVGVKKASLRQPVSHFKTTHSAPRHWVWPARGKVIKPFSIGLRGNAGIDISGHYAEPVRAAARGIVVYSGTGIRGYGNLIIIKHSESFLSAYAYNRAILVRLGQKVKSGQRIAKMGRNNLGQAVLHFEIRRNGKPVNPLMYLR